MKEKTFKIDNFIAIYDNYITKDECENAIKLFENENKLKSNFNDVQNEEKSFMEEVTKKYGEGVLDPKTGTFSANK